MRNTLFASLAVLAAAMAAAIAPGCAHHAVELDVDAARYATASETPRLAQQSILLEVRAEGTARGDVQAEATRVFLGSGKFRLATPKDEPAYKVALAVRERGKTHLVNALLGALTLFLVPVRTAESIAETFVEIRTPSGQLLAVEYAQGRETAELWLLNLVRAERLGGSDARAILRRETLNAACVKVCRTLMPRATE